MVLTPPKTNMEPKNVRKRNVKTDSFWKPSIFIRFSGSMLVFRVSYPPSLQTGKVVSPCLFGGYQVVAPIWWSTSTPRRGNPKKTIQQLGGFAAVKLQYHG